MSEPTSSNVVIVGIDDDTLKAYGKWSDWPRSLHAQAIDNLSQANASVIGFDILFTDVSTDDSILAAAINRAGNVVLATAGVDPLPNKSQTTWSRFLLPTSLLTHASISLGHANVAPDGDGLVRRLPLIAQNSSERTSFAFALAVLHVLFSKPLPQEFPLRDGTLYVLDRSVPVDTLGNMRINFAVGSDAYTTLSYGDIIEGNFNSALVRHKIVLVGMTTTGDTDAWLIPISRNKVAGVWIHAFAIDTILRQHFLIQAGTGTTLFIMLLLIAITGFTLPRLKLRWGGLLVGGLFATYLLIVFAAYDKGYILNILYPAMVLPLVYITSIMFMITAEQSDKQLIRNLFGRYVSTQVATELLNLVDTGKLEFDGQRRTVTVLFADLRGFTQMSEQLPPHTIVNTLNTYLSIIIDRVLANDGMVNKFAGDNVMAVWNAPQPQLRHAQLAVRAAWEAQLAIMELQIKETCLPTVVFGIGINTGEAVAGNVGSTGRAEYTVIGDAVNVASRICGVAPGGEIWIGDETYRNVEYCIEAQALEPQSFKGKSKPILVYKVTAWKQSSFNSDQGCTNR